MNKAPVKLNLLTSQLKKVPDDKKQFDLVSRKSHTLLITLERCVMIFI